MATPVLAASAVARPIWAQAAQAIESAVIQVTREKLKTLAAGKMGYGTTQVGDMVAGGVVD